MKKSILVDATFINSGGGALLLRSLLDRYVSHSINFKVVLDSRVSLPSIYDAYILKVLPPNIFLRELCIFVFSRRFDLVLSLNNLGSPFARCPIFIYFHNVLYLVSTPFSFLKRTYFFICLYFSAGVFVQTESVKALFHKNRIFSVFCKQPIVLAPYFPCYRPLINRDEVCASVSSKIRFIYLSDGHPYKNHACLLSAIRRLHLDSYDFSFTFTVSSKYPHIIEEIGRLRALGCDVKNISYNNESIFSILADHDISIYVSSFESFGLGLIESCLSKLPLLAPFEDYVFDVVSPSYCFHGLGSDSIYAALRIPFFYNLRHPTLCIEENFTPLLELAN
jgi:hypothetical protein